MKIICGETIVKLLPENKRTDIPILHVRNDMELKYDPNAVKESLKTNLKRKTVHVKSVLP